MGQTAEIGTGYIRDKEKTCVEMKWEEQEVRRRGKEEVCDQPTARAAYIGKGAQHHCERSGEKGAKRERHVLGMDIRYPYIDVTCLRSQILDTIQCYPSLHLRIESVGDNQAS